MARGDGENSHAVRTHARNRRLILNFQITQDQGVEKARQGIQQGARSLPVARRLLKPQFASEQQALVVIFELRLKVAPTPKPVPLTHHFLHPQGSRLISSPRKGKGTYCNSTLVSFFLTRQGKKKRGGAHAADLAWYLHITDSPISHTHFTPGVGLHIACFPTGHTPPHHWAQRQDSARAESCPGGLQSRAFTGGAVFFFWAPAFFVTWRFPAAHGGLVV